MLKTVIPSEAGQFFLALRSREALARAVEESLFSARSVLNPSFFSFNFQLSTSSLVLTCPSSPLSLASRLLPQVVRSSGRIPKEIPILLIGSDLGGKVFSEHTSTILLSLHGAGVLSRHKLSPEQELVLRWPERNKETEIRVVGQVGSQDGHHTYGVAFFDQDLNFWEIDFPPVSAAQRELGLLSLICSHCKTLEKVDDSGPEADVCATNEGVLRFCKRCASSTLWTPASAVPPSPATTSSPFAFCLRSGVPSGRHLWFRLWCCRPYRHFWRWCS